MNAVSYIDRAEVLAEAKQYYENVGKEFDAKTREIVLAIHDATESAYRRGYAAGMRAAAQAGKN